MKEWYLYDGPVMVFEHIVANKWKSYTFAPSEAKARSNLAFQAKKRLGLSNGAKVHLPGTIVKNQASI